LAFVPFGDFFAILRTVRSPGEDSLWIWNGSQLGRV